MSIIETVFSAANEVKNGRTTLDAFKHLCSEVDELRDEVCAEFNLTSPANVREEAVDVILCALDIIWLNDPDTSEEEVMDLVRQKLAKWKKYYSHSIIGTHKNG